MTVPAAIVTFMMLWFLCLFVALPIGIQTQGEAGSVVPGTSSSSPETHWLRRKLFWVTVVATALWAVVVYLVVFSPLTIAHLDVWGWY